MSYHHCRIHLPVNAMAELVATDGRCGGHICKISGIRSKLQVKHTWAAAPLEISVPLRH